MAFAFILIYSTKFVFSTNYSDVYQIKQDLMVNYSNEIIPVEVVYTKVHLSLSLEINSISSFDDVGGVLTTICSFHMEWSDQKLVWNPFDYNLAREFYTPLSKIWTPTLQITNTAKNLRLYYDATSTYAYVQFLGEVSVTIGQVLSTTCTPDVRYYPMDYHNCEIRIAPTLSDINVTSTLSVSSITENAQWDLIGSSSKREATSSGIDTHVFTLIIQRRSAFLLVSLVMPVIFLGVIDLFVFILPFDSGERVGFSMTVLLAFAVFLTITTDKLPDASNTISVFCVYLAFMLVFSGLITLVNIFLLSFYHRDEKDKLPCFSFLKLCMPKSTVSSLDDITTKNGNDKVHELREERKGGDDSKPKEKKEFRWYCNVADRIMAVFFALTLFIASTVFIAIVNNASKN
ncbi:hypothetical protein FSP39_011444 [Pinctada imbricata]|uniref:Uncharacterized protein n=1 Tax=Pinctada imbricata TaxID=66713 RepID=A0AA89BZI7_PINIB|nr:hypothetical protein FSP39_011444 [Pinctada imbricata]